MTEQQFNARADLARLKPGTAQRAGARLVLVEGLTVYAAAHQLGVAHQPIYRAVAACNAAVDEARAQIAQLQQLIDAAA